MGDLIITDCEKKLHPFLCFEKVCNVSLWVKMMYAVINGLETSTK